MDEILIEEKKYVSSKQAAKATGYAKDYIGQLCREGRVPARLVGRSWYVLESALHDHRFGNPKDELAENEKGANAEQSAWESPRYETIEAGELPAINRFQKDKETQGPVASDSEVAERLQATWQAWFDRFDTVAGVSTPEAPTQEAGAPTESVGEVIEEEESEEVEAETEVPVRAIHHHPYQPAPREFLPSYTEEQQGNEVEVELLSDEETAEGKRSWSTGRIFMALRMAGVVVAVVSVSLAVLGSGYLDKYIVSNSQVGLIAGVGLYNK